MTIIEGVCFCGCLLYEMCIIGVTIIWASFTGGSFTGNSYGRVFLYKYLSFIRSVYIRGTPTAL